MTYSQDIFIMKFLLSSLLLGRSVSAFYTVLAETYTPVDFFSKFNFYTVRPPLPSRASKFS